jgi:beta-mannosidase
VTDSMRALHDGWTLAPAPGSGLALPATLPAGSATFPVPATVPGCVHTDLLAAGVIGDPLVGDNELRQAWIGRTDWVYETAFD